MVELSDICRNIDFDLLVKPMQTANVGCHVSSQETATSNIQTNRFCMTQVFRQIKTSTNRELEWKKQQKIEIVRFVAFIFLNFILLHRKNGYAVFIIFTWPDSLQTIPHQMHCPLLAKFGQWRLQTKSFLSLFQTCSKRHLTGLPVGNIWTRTQ